KDESIILLLRLSCIHKLLFILFVYFNNLANICSFFSEISCRRGIFGMCCFGSCQYRGRETDDFFFHFCNQLEGKLPCWGFPSFMIFHIWAQDLGTARQKSYPQPPNAIHFPLLYWCSNLCDNRCIFSNIFMEAHK